LGRLQTWLQIWLVDGLINRLVAGEMVDEVVRGLQDRIPIEFKQPGPDQMLSSEQICRRDREIVGCHALYLASPHPDRVRRACGGRVVPRCRHGDRTNPGRW
jgi:hypothetical protein